MERPLALIVDGDAAVRAQLHQLLEHRGVDSVGAANGDEANAILRSRQIRLLLADPRARGLDPGALVRAATSLDPPAAWIALTRDGRPAALAEAAAVLPLPADERAFVGALERARREIDLVERVRSLERRLQRRAGYRGYVGRSPAIRRLRERAEALAATGEPLVVWGEPGSGRHELARQIHAAGPRAEAPLVIAGPGSLDDDALREHAVRAAGGTLLVELAGGEPADGRDPWEHVRAAGSDARTIVVVDEPNRTAPGRRRVAPALAGRPGAVALHVPPLRERREDVAPLACAFVDGVREINRLPPIEIDSEALDALERHDWPENVRGLRNAIERGVILSRDGRLRAVDLPESVREARPASEEPVAATRAFRDAKRTVVERFERGYLVDLMRRHAGNVTAASQHAGMLRSALQRLLRKYSIKSAEFRATGRRRRPSDPRVAAE